MCATCGCADGSARRPLPLHRHQHDDGTWHEHGAAPEPERAAVIGRITTDQPGIVLLRTAFGGTRIVDLLVGDPLPRIC